MAKSPKTFTSHSPPRARTLSGPATRRRWTRELLQSRNRAFGPNGVPTTSRQTSATRTDTTSRLPISLGSTNKRYEPSTHLRPAAKESKEYVILFPHGGGEHDRGRNRPRSERLGLELAGSVSVFLRTKNHPQMLGGIQRFEAPL